MTNVVYFGFWLWDLIMMSPINLYNQSTTQVQNIQGQQKYWTHKENIYLQRHVWSFDFFFFFYSPLIRLRICIYLF